MPRPSACSPLLSDHRLDNEGPCLEDSPSTKTQHRCVSEIQVSLHHLADEGSPMCSCLQHSTCQSICKVHEKKHNMASYTDAAILELTSHFARHYFLTLLCGMEKAGKQAWADWALRKKRQTVENIKALHLACI